MRYVLPMKIIHSLPVVLFLLLSCSGQAYKTAVEDTGDSIDTQPVDSDGDGVPDGQDACPEDGEQWTDADEDEACDEVDDACPMDPTGWVDSDGDGLCDPSDPCPADPQNLDTDGDGLCDDDDPCPEDANGTVDTDGDGACDPSDDCPDDPNGWVDSNGDGFCDDTDDSDGDGLLDGEEGEYGEDCAISNPHMADTDGDGIGDNEDPYPRDPWPEFILFRNQSGTIDLMLSNRDGTFQSPVTLGDVYGGTSNPNYRYLRFLISDFNDDGRMDFLALGDEEPDDPSNPYDIWFFQREKADEINQRLLGTWDRNPFGSLADFDNDAKVDLLASELTKAANNYIDSVELRFYGNQGLMETANCFATADPLNPDGCAFVEKDAINLYDFANGQWAFKLAQDSVDVGGDGNRDVAVLRFASGGNSPAPVKVLHGNGDGTFTEPSTRLFSHNSDGCGSSPANSVLFGDFDSDDVGDVVAGLDDDGDAGSAWFYPGTVASGSYDVDTTACVEAFDLNPADESGGENAGHSTSARAFDFDFNGVLDIIVGYRYQGPWSGPSRTVLLFGNGDGTFGTPVQVREFAGDNNYASQFAVPRRVCERFPL